ncbi:helix-turn-helix domain-containing protein [Nocardia vinacea]|jgi:hypothetical protein|uniref:helix-turn-helix domain-containing protein n=1 Tax=Nocardia vinacea TaxID=96468 RepID=UPI003AF3795B
MIRITATRGWGAFPGGVVKIFRDGADLEMLGKAKGLIHEIASETKLADTLAAWIAHDGYRTRAAETLNIHPRTLDYRLRRMVAGSGSTLVAKRRGTSGQSAESALRWIAG